MRHLLLDFPDLPLTGFRAALGKNRPATLEKSAGNAPNAPDPYSVTGVQANLNQQAAAFNKALNLNNYSNPFGSQSSAISGYDPATGAPIYQTNISANPQLQQLLNQQIGGVNASNLGELSGYLSNIGGQAQGIARQYGGLFNQLDQGQALDAQRKGQDAAYQAQAQYLDPQFSQQEESLGAKLAAQGLAPGSQAYGNAYRNFNNQKQQAYSNAQNQAIMTGSQLGAQNLQNQIAGLTTQGGLLQGQLGALGNDINSINARAGMNQMGYQNLNSVAGLIPGFSTIGQAGVNPADIASAMQNQYLGKLGQYNADQQGRNATMSNLAGLFGNLGRANSLSNIFGGNGLAGYGNALSAISPGAAGSLGDALGMSFGGIYGPETQAGLDALIGSFNGGTTAAAAGGAAEAGAAGAAGTGAAGGGAGAAGAGSAAVPSALPIATALPFAIAAYGMFNGLTGRGDNGTPLTNMQDMFASALSSNPQLLQQYGSLNNYLAAQGIRPDQTGNYSWDQADQAMQLLSPYAPKGTGWWLGGNLMDNGGN